MKNKSKVMKIEPRTKSSMQEKQDSKLLASITCVSKEKARRLLGVSKTSLWKLEKEGFIQSIKLKGMDKRVFRLSEIRRYLEESEESSNSFLGFSMAG